MNKSRAKQGTKALISRKEANFPWNALQPDIHSSDDEVSSHGSRENSGQGSWEGTEEEEKAKKEDEEEASKSDIGSAV